jgi:SAM-dependent methyltransferase
MRDDVTTINDQAYLRSEQYHNADRLNVRVELHKRFTTNGYGWHRWVFDQLDLDPQDRVLELGCGPGYLWIENANRIPPGWTITLSDFSTGMLEETRRNLANVDRAFHFEVVDAQAIPFADASFDAVIANHMLYHVPDRERAYREIARVLQRGGRFYAATNGNTHMRELAEIVQEFDPDISIIHPGEAIGFRLDDSSDELARFFDHVEVRRYEDALLVTEATPLVDYILSMSWRVKIGEDRRAEFARFVEDRISQHGPIRITKDAGLFVALAGTAEV